MFYISYSFGNIKNIKSGTTSVRIQTLKTCRLYMLIDSQLYCMKETDVWKWKW